MFDIRYATEGDKRLWLKFDKEISESEFLLKTREKRAYLILDDHEPAGVMRYNLIWDSIPFLTLLYLKKACRGKGLGREAMLFWEKEMASLDYKMVMTSTQVNEETQHFYRKLGYRERGSLFLDNTPYEQPQEMFMLKTL